MRPHNVYGGLMLGLNSFFNLFFSSSRVVLCQKSPCGLLDFPFLLVPQITSLVCGWDHPRVCAQPRDNGDPVVGPLRQEGAGGHQLAVLVLGALAWPSALS